jgi:hypothetical protein
VAFYNCRIQLFKHISPKAALNLTSTALDANNLSRFISLESIIITILIYLLDISMLTYFAFAPELKKRDMPTVPGRLNVTTAGA